MRQSLPLNLLVHRRDTGCETLLTVFGEIDVESAPLLRTALTRCLLDGRSSIDVDLTGVDFCDSCGLHVFLDTSQAAADAGGRLLLHHPGPVVDRLLSITGTGAVLLASPDRSAPIPTPESEAPRSVTDRAGEAVPTRRT